MNSLQKLSKYGQSFWIDNLSRNLIVSGELKRLVEQDGLRGETSNPTIFEIAIAERNDYDQTIFTILKTNPVADSHMIYEKLTVEDIQMAADVFRPVYDKSKGDDGFVCLEVSPLLANNTEGTCVEARYLWQQVNRPNLMIKVPATLEGIPAIETLTAEGININITLMFNLDHYEMVSNAYIQGIKRCKDPKHMSSVASFFLSRIDSRVDPKLESIGTADALALKAKTAIAIAKTAYQRFRKIFYGETFAQLKKQGIRVQRPLWASTGTKNPAYSDVLYIESLIGRDTVNTMKPETINAFRDHGKVQPTLEQGLDEAKSVLERLNKLGINIKSITEQLQVDGVKSFSDSYRKLLTTLETKKVEFFKKPSYQ